MTRQDASWHCRTKFTSRFRPIHHIAKFWNKPRLIVRCTRVCRRKSIVRQNFSGKGNAVTASLCEARGGCYKLRLKAYPRTATACNRGRRLPVEIAAYNRARCAHSSDRLACSFGNADADCQCNPAENLCPGIC